jgi:hypothetical protein
MQVIYKDRFRPGLPATFLARIWVRLGLESDQKYRDKGWSSYAERVQYKLLKFRANLWSRKTTRQVDRLADNIRSERLFDRYCNQAQEPGPALASGEVTFKHSGNAGDLIYALPAMKAICGARSARLFLKMDVPVNGWTLQQHPLGRSGLTADVANKLKPLLEHQPWVAGVQVHQHETVDYDLDAFREVPNIKHDRGDIMRWYFWLFAVHGDLSRPWLEIRPAEAASRRIVLARSSRYRNPNLDYGFLREAGEIDFVGTRSEFEEMRGHIPQLRHAECTDFLHLARIIQAARFFIGNQSFPYSLAEALKVPRILEVYPECPNVVPAGPNVGEAFFQPHFERLVRRFQQTTAADALAAPREADCCGVVP